MLAIIVGQLGINVLCPDGSNDCPYQNVVTNVSAFIQSMTSLLVISFCWQSINFSLHKYPIWVWQYDQRTWISIALDLFLCFQVLEASLSVPFAYPVLQAVSSILIFFVGLASVKFPIFSWWSHVSFVGQIFLHRWNPQFVVYTPNAGLTRV